MLKGNKGVGDFTAKTNQFFLDVGWIRLTKMLDFHAMVHDFKNTDLDPRELILLYKNLVVSNREAIKRNFSFKEDEFAFDLSAIIEQYKMENNRPDIKTEVKLRESKKAVAAILELKNTAFVSEIKKRATIKF
mmetsp:Transcript_16010/g.24829  ORF Transcript_16010/g.24829 Transcript_16010/m.24829 type:complete len:133 (-) Transcript_16010:1603-2001(-)